MKGYSAFALGSLALLGAGAAISQTQAPAAPAQGFAPEAVAQVCAACHGDDLSGGRGPSIVSPDILRNRTDQQLFSAIHDGIPNSEMGAFKDSYSDAQIWQMVGYLRGRAAAAPPPAAATAAATAAPTVTPVDPDNRVVRSEKQAFRIEVVARDLETPWALAFLPDGRMLVTERPGRLRIVDKDGRLLPEPVQGTPDVLPVQDGGLLDIALSPDYAETGWIYLSFSERLAGSPDPAPPEAGQRPTFPLSMTVISRGKLNAQNQWVEQQILYRAPPELYTNRGEHYGSRFLFDGKGHVFYSLGERGDMRNSQNLGTPLGKIHRINMDGSVPADNPFVNRAGALPTIWSYGHRNPEGLAFDPVSGALWESEHGPGGGDEINVIEKGGNYGWGVVSMGQQPGIERQHADGMIDPVAWYSDPTLAPSGITFYTGDRYPGWKNNLFVAALRGQQLRRLEVKDGKVLHQEAVFEQLGRVRASAIGPDGLLYVLLQNPTGPGTGLRLSDPTPGMVVRLVPVQ